MLQTIKSISLSNQKCKVPLTLINLHLNEGSQELQYYPFGVKLNKCVGTCNTVNDLSNTVYIPNKTEDLNVPVFNTITGKNESKILAKYILCEY